MEAKAKKQQQAADHAVAKAGDSSAASGEAGAAAAGTRDEAPAATAASAATGAAGEAQAPYRVSADTTERLRMVRCGDFAVPALLFSSNLLFCLFSFSSP